MSRTLTIVRQGATPPSPAPGDTIISTDELKRWIRSGRIVGMPRRYDIVRLWTDRVGALGRPLPAALAARWLSRRLAVAADAEGDQRELTIDLLARWTVRLMAEPMMRGGLLRRIGVEVVALETALREGPAATRLDRGGSPLYLRGDLAFGLKAGGSVGHTAGVINHLGDFGGPPIVLTSNRVPTVREAIETHVLDPDEAFWNFKELPAFVMNAALEREALDIIHDRQVAFIYQRYTLNGYAAVRLSQRWGVPLVTEYNGSEVWVARHWGRPLKYEALSSRIERLNLRASHLVSVVSAPLADEVRAQGVEPRRVLVNPNGVDPDRYHPDVDGSAVRARLGLEGKTVIGFIGTFGPWHGAEVLAEAFVRLLRARPALRESVRLLWIGDGVTLPRVREILATGGALESCVFSGLVPQEEGPAHLAACDVFASPHVPNADGSPFFGSPTKLFEYMAMGRGIVASDLDQIGEVLQDERTALLVPPGDADALASALGRLVVDAPLGRALGDAARREVLARFTWRAHVHRMVQALEERVQA